MQSGLKSLGARLLGHTYIQENNCYHLICLPKPDLSTLWTWCLLKHFECNWLINSLACCVVSHITITTDLVCFVHILKNKQTNKNFQINCIYCLQCVPLHQCAIIYIYIFVLASTYRKHQRLEVEKSIVLNSGWKWWLWSDNAKRSLNQTVKIPNHLLLTVNKRWVQTVFEHIINNAQHPANILFITYSQKTACIKSMTEIDRKEAWLSAQLPTRSMRCRQLCFRLCVADDVIQW